MKRVNLKSILLAITAYLLLAPFGTVLYSKPSTVWNVIRRQPSHTPSIILPQSFVSISNGSKAAIESKEVEASVRSVAEDICRTVLFVPQETQLNNANITSVENTAEYIYTASLASIPIRDARMILSIGRIKNNIIAVRNSIPNYSANTITASISREAVLTRAQEQLSSSVVIVTAPTLVFVADPRNNLLRLCYELRVRDGAQESWRLTFDATSGALIEKRLLVHHFDDGNLPQAGPKGVVKGAVHLHTPFDTLTMVGFPFINISNGTTTTSADSTGSFSIPSSGSNLTATLTNVFMGVVNTGGTSAALSAVLPLKKTTILFDSLNSDIAERDAYNSVNWARLFIRRLDIGLLRLDRFLTVNVNVNSSCNAFYDPTNISLNFFSAGSGCENTAEISDVVYHEFGHRVQHAVYSTVIGGDSDIVNTSLGEGFSDTYSSLMRDDPRIGIDFFGNNNTLLRTCDNKNTWPDSLSLDPHFNGEIVSGAFWDLRKMIGLNEATKLFHRMMYYTPDAPEIYSNDGLLEAYLQTLMATIIADDNDNNLKNGTPHIQQILAAFAKHNVTLAGFIKIDVPHLPDQDTGSAPYPLSTTVSYNGPVGELDTTSLKLYYSIDDGKTYNNVPFIRKDTFFLALIPAQAAGSVVNYYVGCKLNISTDSITAPNPQYSFLVGYNRIFFDDCEHNRGWKTGIAGDQATTGIWELAKPYGTYTDPTPPIFFVQQDTDHSPNGVMCYVTGNRNGLPGNLTRDPGYDDVGGGATTLVSPNIHFDSTTSPIIRYWYYYSNDQGDNPGIPEWVVNLSVDNGATWKQIIRTNNVTDGWTQETIHLADYVPPTHTVQLEFIASNFIGAIVEAGIDDYEVLDVATSGNKVSVRKPIAEQISFPRPNPVIAGTEITFGQEYTTIDLFDLRGNKIISSSGNTLLIPQQASEGVYVLRTSDRDGNYATYKIVVTK
ncbi:MAG TPA: hypothetical protein VEW28_11015 [Candidatus Kapabacteria bacterium]|nr:hypothetical protein [Candidatus Kapabacteria bacterium]